MAAFKNFSLDCFNAFHLALGAVLIAALLSRRIRQSFETRTVGTATAGDLAFIRIVTCLVAMAYLLLDEDLPSLAAFPPSWHDPPGYMSLFGAELWEWLLGSRGRLLALQWMIVGLLALGVAGLLTRLALPLAAAALLVASGLLRGWGKDFHTGYLPLYGLVTLCFLPCGHAWSVDALWRNSRRRRADETGAAGSSHDVAASQYGWAVYACYAAISVPYLQLGFSKLVRGGPFWFDGRSLLHSALEDNLNLARFDIDLALKLYQAPVILFTGVALFGLLAELLYPFTLILPRLRRFVPVCVSLLHVGILLLQDVLFLGAILMPLIFLRPSRWRSAGTGDRLSAPGPGRLRAAFVPVCLVLCMLLLSYTSYRGLIRWQWPVTTFQMYASKASTSTTVSFRRCLIHFDDGGQIPSDFSEAVGFLANDYRIDRGIRRGPRFFARVIAHLQPVYAPRRIVGVTSERRSWDYATETLAEALQRPADASLYVTRLSDAPPGEVALTAEGEPIPLHNGDFKAWPASPGPPRQWQTNHCPVGCGIAGNEGELVALLPPWGSGKTAALFQIIKAETAWYDRSLQLDAWVWSESAGAFLEFQIMQPDGSYEIAGSGAHEGGGVWRRLSLKQRISNGYAQPPEIRPVLRSPPGNMAAFDDVTLTLLAPEQQAPAPAAKIEVDAPPQSAAGGNAP